MENYSLDIKLKNELSFWFKEHKREIIYSIIFVAIGIIIGIIISLNDRGTFKILSSNEENLFSYITGSADKAGLFWKRLLNGFLGLTFIFLFTLNYYSSFLGVTYLLYQSTIFVVAVSSLIKFYGVGVKLFSLIVVIPTNILLIAISCVMFANCYHRARIAHIENMRFAQSFDKQFWINLIIISCIYIILQIIINLILPLILRATYIINY